MTEPELFTTIDWDWSCYTEKWDPIGLAVPVVNGDDERGLVCTIRADARGLNNGWPWTMPVESVPMDLFVDADDPRNANPPLNVDADWGEPDG